MTYEAWRTSYQSSEQAARAAYAECERLRAKIAEMENQEPDAWAATDETKTVVEALGMNQSRRFDSPLFLAPGARPTPSVPREAIEKMLTQLMDIAVSNGANSISMPDEYVEVAAWLCGIPAQPAPSVSAELLDRAIDTIGRFCSDEGWAQSDMDTLDALIAASEAKR